MTKASIVQSASQKYQSMRLRTARFHGDWNDMISPQADRQSERREVMVDLKGKPYSIHVHHGLKWIDPTDGNADLEVRFEDGSRYAATFFTLNNLRLSFEKNEQTGECREGLYLWASDMVIVKVLTEASISETVADLIAQGEFEKAFSSLSSDTPSPASQGLHSS